MKKVPFPLLPRGLKPLLTYYVGRDWIVAITESKDNVMEFWWDGVSTSFTYVESHLKY